MHLGYLERDAMIEDSEASGVRPFGGAATCRSRPPPFPRAAPPFLPAAMPSWDCADLWSEPQVGDQVNVDDQVEVDDVDADADSDGCDGHRDGDDWHDLGLGDAGDGLRESVTISCVKRELSSA
jgi:hypothetical protein